MASSLSRGALGALLLLAAGVVGCSGDAPPRHGATRILVLALDGLDPGLVERFAAEGRLPRISALRAAGSSAILEAERPLTSPVLWTTVATGVRGERHGITGWVIDGLPVTGAARRRPAFWNLFAAFGRRPATVGWLASWPPDTESGILVSDRAILPDELDAIEPPGAVDLQLLRETEPPADVARRFTGREFDADYRSRPTSSLEFRVNYLLERRLLAVHYRDHAFARAGKSLAARPELDLVAVYLRGADYVGHGFWQYFDPAPFRAQGWTVEPELVAAFGGIIPRYYEALDRLVGELVDAAGPGTDVVLLSDHGFEPTLPPHEVKTFDHGLLSGSHRSSAVLIASGPSFARGAVVALPPQHVDILPTLLHLARLPIASDLEGRVLDELLTAEARARRSRSIDAYPPYNPDPRRRGSVRDLAILDDLRSLGYIN